MHADYFKVILNLLKCQHPKVYARKRIHLSNVLAEHFLNSLPEKTTKDIRMKFSQCPFKNIFIGCHSQIVAFIYKSFMWDKRLFLRFTAHALRAIAISHFKLDILHVSKPPRQKNRKYCEICNQVVQYTVLNNGCLNSFNRKRQFRV